VRRNRGLPTAGRPYSAQLSKAFSQLAFVDQLELLNNQVRATSRRFRELFVRYPDEAVLLSFPGMNQITAETMLAYMVEHRARFATSDTLEPRPARRQSLGQRPPPHRPVPLRREQADAPRHRPGGRWSRSATAINAGATRQALDQITEYWDQSLPAIIRLPRNVWDEFVPFLDYEPDLTDPARSCAASPRGGACTTRRGDRHLWAVGRGLAAW
jgi:hypothetical protein